MRRRKGKVRGEGGWERGRGMGRGGCKGWEEDGRLRVGEGRKGGSSAKINWCPCGAT
jgi:hypothetical protein